MPEGRGDPKINQCRWTSSSHHGLFVSVADAAASPFKSATVTVSAEWPLRRMVTDLSREVDADTSHSDWSQRSARRRRWTYGCRTPSTSGNSS